ncbi:hypothetical protein VTL71DRAFT_5666 [Oculimacula yallundae]|uniref:Heterokaryon incompatibility domain-containing protein n=1 Tax=Oculimacula yallundae TaxID=86028 RepID=A0ABR4BY40_9HELO
MPVQTRSQSKKHDQSSSTTGNKAAVKTDVISSSDAVLGSDDGAASNVNAKATAHQLCSVCQEIVSQSHLLNDRADKLDILLNAWGSTERREQYSHHPTLDALHASASDGCHLCTLLCNVVNEGPAEPSPEASEDEDEDKKAEDPMEGLGPSHLSALNMAPMLRSQKKKERLDRKQQSQRIKADRAIKSDGIVLQFSWSCYRWDKTVKEKRNSHISINLECGWYLGYPMETNGKKALTVRPAVSQVESSTWEANRDDPVEVTHDAQTSLSTGSDASFDLARRWLLRCKSDHKVCHDAERSVKIAPTRVLDVGSDKEPTIRLKSPHQEWGHQEWEYVSLSHRWGDSQPLRLLKDNIETFQSEIKWEDLPQTFRDAVTITQKLGYRFLWIDSLCIIQDSKEDWERESTVMGQIYRGSALNISAGGADGCTKGCFATRNPLQRRPCILTGTATDGMVATRRCPDEWTRTSHTAPRGWVFQERMLAPRTLHYNRTTISWECICLDATEGRPDGDTWDWERDKRYRRPKELFQTLMDSRPELLASKAARQDAYEERFGQAWSELVRDYASKILTQRADKLVALHGIVSILSENTHLRNFCGLWAQHISCELMWSTGSYPELKRPEFFDKSMYRAPSWSWACVDSGVCFNYPRLVRGREENILGFSMWVSYVLKPQFDVIEFEISEKSNGEVTTAILVLEGRLRKIEWQENSGVKGFKHHSQARSISDTWMPDFQMATAMESWALLLMTGEASDNVEDGRVDTMLILDPVKANREHVFRRSGYAEQFYWKDDTYPIFRDGREELKERIYLI